MNEPDCRQWTTFLATVSGCVVASTTRILGVVGSLRAGSFNRALLRANVELAPPDVALEVFDISDVPLYNADLDTPSTRPARASALRNAISDADAVLIVTPEHNWGPSAATKGSA